MIKDHDVAERILKLHFRLGAELDASVSDVQGSCSARELAAYRRAVGLVMGHMLTAVINPILSEHPELKPHAMR